MPTNNTPGSTEGPHLDRLHCPALLVDARLRVHGCNPAVARLMSTRDALLTIAAGPEGYLGHLQVRSAEARRRIKQGLTDVLGGQRPTLGLTLPRPGSMPVTLRIAATATAGLALIELRDPHDTRVDAAMLQDLFGLTPAEATTVSLVCDGRSPADIAGLLGVQLNTVNVHVKRALAKCGVGRQPQMVALLLRSVAACEERPPAHAGRQSPDS
ncbi:MAG: helix-turn-helix transcriptional regulator [Rubrivivax sp.]